MRIATAEWAKPEEIEARYLYRDGTVWLGRSPSEKPVPVGYRDDRHVCVVSGSRGGKGTTSIVNNLILWPGSLCVVDPKGENATVTAARRGGGSKHCQGLGQAVKVLDPFKAAQVDDSLRGRFNPLDALDPDNDETIDEAGRIADAIVVVHEGGKNADPFWDESARAMVKGIILHVLTAPLYEGRRNLITVRKLILRGDWESVEELRAQGEKNLPSGQGLLWSGMTNNPAFDGLVAGIGDSFLNMLMNGEKQYDSVLQVANRNTEFIDSPAMQRCLEASDFQLSDLKTRPEGLSMYLCLPQRYMSTHYRWLRMMIALTVTEMEKVRGRPATGYPVLMVLDEFAGLKRMEVIESAVAQIASFGVKLFFVLQSLEQLKAVYKDNWETFLANSGLKVFFNLEDHFSREYVSKLIGETEVIRQVGSSSDSSSQSESISQSVTGSQSETQGRSSSTGTSETEGTNSGKSRNLSSSGTWGENYNYTPGWFFGRNYDRRVGESWSQTFGSSEGWTEGKSQSTSRSRTAGTSESQTTGTSETDGTTHGTSQSRTAGSSETIQKRALITPDEIGQVFARVDERAHQAYPGLALVVISGARPVPVHRVNYYEDYEFMGLFDPPPDYPWTPPKQLTVEGRTLGLSLAEYGLKLGRWSIDAGRIAAARDEGALVVTWAGTPAAPIRVPRGGKITAVNRSAGGDVPDGPLFSLMYYEDGAGLIDPFAEVRAFCEKVRAQREARELAAEEKEQQKRKEARNRKRVWIAAACCVLAVVIAIGYAIKSGKQRSEEERAAALIRERQTAEQANPKIPEPQPAPAPARPREEEGAPPEPSPASNAPPTPTLAYTLRTGSNVVASLAFSPNSRLLASGNPERQVASGGWVGDTTVWDVTTRRLLRVLAGHERTVSSVAFSPDGRILASGSHDTTIKLWDLATGKEIRTLTGHKDGVNSLAFSPNGRVLASGSDTIKLWDVATGAELLRLAYDGGSVRSVAFSPDGRVLVSGSDDRTVKLWDVSSGTMLRAFAGHKDFVRCVAFSPDGRVVASGSADDTIRLWDAATGEELRTLSGEFGVESLAFSPDGRVLASADLHRIRFWNAATGVELGSVDSDENNPYFVAFSPDGRFLASGGKQIEVWKMTSAK